ncbi:MAG: hypothetical protein GW839_01215 [Flavobacteriales bacterium]|nr:hypothetical protein [Flavobacteriia bacterium]NCP05647.1 hypothetical protein [Flavobacteriales bacterium]PIV93100.1 MAG: hypothetical protein COW44_11475 [Flavobacteriaceae bacterium CG17_big_fil_post_rev_8_21_14_2_50_33_15]PIY11906.1 MAG: hypothetical protein COZ17_05375 [Flavobacteriaceae bacterium CG_4_10_14_3_um_filter_33_47]PJB18323.1 MAG: hypothetical protein CO117_08595 [Flavobacteriaceae bacterium CG_4_9_14_3_um_filter_33_16]
MALVVLFSTTSFTIDKHYCGKILVDTAVFNKAKGCGMEMQVSTINSECSTVKKSCCTEEQITVQGQDELQLNLDKLTLEKQLFVASFLYSYASLFESAEKPTHSFLEYPPPLIVKSIYKLDETYLI